MPTPECKANLINQTAIFVTGLVGLIVSPASWGGLLGACFGIAFGKPVKFWFTGVGWLAFGIVVSVLSNSYVTKLIDHIGAGFAAFVIAFIVTMFKERIFDYALNFLNARVNHDK